MKDYDFVGYAVFGPFVAIVLCLGLYQVYDLVYLSFRDARRLPDMERSIVITTCLSNNWAQSDNEAFRFVFCSDTIQNDARVVKSFRPDLVTSLADYKAQLR